MERIKKKATGGTAASNKGGTTMNLIEVNSSTIGAEVKQTVNARELHAFLEIKKDFSSWIKAQIERARLVENRDFVKLTQKGERQILVEYHLAIEAGKHVSMMCGTDKGFEVRDYFIACEEKAKAAPAINLNDPAFLRSTLITYTEKVIELEHKVDELQPKAEIADRISISDGLFGFRQTAKILGVNENKFRQWLRSKDWVYYLDKRMTGKSHVIRAGYIDEKTKLLDLKDVGEKLVREMFFTPKGIHRLAKEFNVANIGL